MKFVETSVIRNHRSLRRQMCRPGKEDCIMYTEMYISGEGKNKRKKMLKAGGIILWVLMIGVTMFFTFQYVVIAG